ncbi:hypothetical protein HWD99_08735 [Microbacterium sp. C5A9]|uniref:hypothetical protein n=1 Tax=Microbacterium sp. C5A9 TaxID=2736663 RepID=UPI001F52597A|nr:hypothetical protein [Microbacterium sp. C5A9]MCI1018706.1 hypothetical protein [Microbacterium sp. C5A9]
MDQNTGRTPHSEEPAEGSAERDELHGNSQGAAQGGAIQGDSSHGDAARGAIQGEAEDGNAQGAAQGGAIQGDSSHGESPRGAIQGDASPDRESALGGDEHTEEQLTADNEVEQDTLRTLDPDDAPA